MRLGASGKQRGCSSGASRATRSQSEFIRTCKVAENLLFFFFSFSAFSGADSSRILEDYVLDYFYLFINPTHLFSLSVSFNPTYFLDNFDHYNLG